jgi:hypothetical protein
VPKGRPCFAASSLGEITRPISDHEDHAPAALSIALIRDPAMQREQFRAEMDERPRLIVPGEDHGRAVRVVKTPGQDVILRPPIPEITPSARILQLAAEHDIEPEAGG